MGLIQFDRRLTLQPQGMLRVDWDNPICKGLLFAAVNGYDAVAMHPTELVQVGAGKYGRTERGQEAYYRPSSDVADVTIIGHLRLTSDNGDYAGLTYGFYTNDSINQDIGVGLGEVGTGGGDIYGVRRDSGGGTTTLEANVTLPWEAIVGISGTFGSGNALYYKNGTYSANVNRRGTGAFATNSLKRHSKCAATSTGKESAWMFRWGRILGEKEHGSIASNPWQIFKRRIWVPVSAAGGGTATVTPSIIASTASIGSHTVARTAVAAVTASRTEPTVSFGTATVARSSVAAVTPSRVASTATIGAHVVSAAGLASVAPTRIASTVTFGAATVARTAVAAVSPTRIASTASIGAHVVTVAGMGAISAARIESTVSFGAAMVARTAVAAVSPARIDSAASIPTHTVARSAVRSIAPGRIDSSVTFGIPSVSSSSTAQIVVGRIESTVLVRSPVVSSSVPGTVGRPASDTSNSGWAASSGTDLYAMLDETGLPNPSDYIVATAAGALCELTLNPTAYPGTASQVLYYRASSSTGNSVIVRLKNTGGAVVRSETQALTAVDTEYSITLTAPEIAAITSGALSVQLESA